MHDAYIGFHLTRMLPRTKRDNEHIGARCTSLYLYLPDDCASYSMSFLAPFYITPNTPNLRSLWHGATMCRRQPSAAINPRHSSSHLTPITSHVWHELERHYYKHSWGETHDEKRISPSVRTVGV
ncbi:hypothetical protein BDR03DRAFT_372396 [Suillus americanus]|nr:hypothetical protein BDR03DRAFT_372396 [Suillus americanus]